MDAAIPVTAPLRYGRRSGSRDDTYTMVFSESATRNGVGTGVALSVPLLKELAHPRDLTDEARCLWSAEANRPITRRGVVSASWGSVALLTNPASDLDPAFLDEWAALVSDSPLYAQLSKLTGEAPVIDAASGLANIPWPKPVEPGADLPLDALLLTATDPTIKDEAYPTPAEVAAAWKREPDRIEYFRLNRTFGIRTAEDEEIQAVLGG